MKSGNAYGKGAKAKATKLHSQLVRSRGRCENCGDQGPTLQTAHIISRRYSNVRTDENNAFCLCAKCHMRFTAWPLEFSEFVISKIGLAGYGALYEKSQQTTKVDWAAEVLRLEQLLKEAA